MQDWLPQLGLVLGLSAALYVYFAVMLMVIARHLITDHVRPVVMALQRLVGTLVGLAFIPRIRLHLADHVHTPTVDAQPLAAELRSRFRSFTEYEFL